MPRFGLDISSVPFNTGVSHYTSNLVQALIPLLNPEDSLVLFGSSLRQHAKMQAFMNSLNVPRTLHLVLRPYYFPPKLVSWYFHTLNAPLSWLTGKLDVFHAWDWYIPKPGKTRLVSTVHDLALFKYPNTAHPEIRDHHEAALKRLKDYHATVIAVSQTTKTDLISLFNFDEQAVHVIPEALPEESKILVQKSEKAAILERYHISKPYFLMVGTKEPRKNYEKQIEAWLPYQPEFDLVIAGKPGWIKLPKHPGLHNLGLVTGRELSALYQGATLLLYVSLYEGFGLPILEAFYHQVPVVTAKNSGMLEVAGSAAALADPGNVDDIGNAINHALENQETLIQEGSKRLRLFSWEKTAQQTLAIYQDLAL